MTAKTCVRCGRVGTQAFYAYGDGTYECLSDRRCSRRSRNISDEAWDRIDAAQAAVSVPLIMQAEGFRLLPDQSWVPAESQA